MEIRVVSGKEMQAIVQPDGVKWPETADFVCAFDNGSMIGRVGCIPIAHLEGTWVHPNHRRGTVGYRIVRKMESELKSSGLTHVFAFSQDETVTDYLCRMGYIVRPLTVLTREL